MGIYFPFPISANVLSEEVLKSRRPHYHRQPPQITERPLIEEKKTTPNIFDMIVDHLAEASKSLPPQQMPHPQHPREREPHDSGMKFHMKRHQRERPVEIVEPSLDYEPSI